MTATTSLTDLKPIRELHKQGRIPYYRLRHVLVLCTRRKFPSVRIHGIWHSTEAEVEQYFWDHLVKDASPEFKRIAAKRRTQSDARVR